MTCWAPPPDTFGRTMENIRGRFVFAVITVAVAATALTACAPSQPPMVEANPYSEAIEAAETAAEGISADEAKEMGVFAADGDALISGYEVKLTEERLVIKATVNNVSEVEDTYEVMLTTEDGQAAYSRAQVPAESERTIEVVIEGAVEGEVEMVLNGVILGESIDVETLSLTQ